MKNKRKQAASKLIKCDLCNMVVHSRGLHSHMRQVHHIVIEKLIKIIPVDSPTIVNATGDYAPANRLTIVKATDDYTQTTKIVEEITTYKKVELVPGSRGGKVKGDAVNFLSQLDAHVAAGRNTMLFNSSEPSVKIS